MQQLLLALALAILAPSSHAPTRDADPVATLHQFADAFNKGDVKAAAAVCANETVIIDEFAPYEWHGVGGCAKWMDAYAADATKNKIADGIVTLGTPLHVDVEGDRAYLVVPVTYHFNRDSKPVREDASTLTVAMQKIGASWRITGWAWTKI